MLHFRSVFLEGEAVNICIAARARTVEYIVRCLVTAALLFSSQGSFSENVGLLVHCVNLSIILSFPALVVLSVPSMTPGKHIGHLWTNHNAAVTSSSGNLHWHFA